MKAPFQNASSTGMLQLQGAGISLERVSSPLAGQGEGLWKKKR